MVNNLEELENFLKPTIEAIKPRAIARKLSEIEREHITWLWPGFLPNKKLSIVDGMPGVGKSTLTADLAAKVSSGLPFPCGATNEPKGVAFIAVEDGVADTIKPRVIAAGGNEEMVHFIHVEQGGNEVTPDLSKHLQSIREELERIGNIGLLIIDPIMALLGDKVDSYRDQDVRTITTPLARLAEELDISILIVRHPNKSASSNALMRGGGSMAFIGAARVGWVVGKHPDNPEVRILAVAKSNIGAMPESLEFRLDNDLEQQCARVHWMGKSEISADNLYTEQSGEEKSLTEEAMDWLQEFLSQNGMDSATVKREATKNGITNKSLRRAREKLGVLTPREGSGTNHITMWVLPDPLMPNSSTYAPLNVGISGGNGHKWAVQAEFEGSQPQHSGNPWEK